jgi:two-component system response regulator NreC
MTTIVLAEDHEIVREGFRAILEAEGDFQVVGEAGNGLEAIRLTESLRPDVLIVDLMMPGLNGLEVVRRVRQHTPRTRCIVLSMHDNEAYVSEALRNGALGYILKDSGAAELKKAVRAVRFGQRYLGPPLSERSVEAYLRAALGEDVAVDPYDLLTNREREIFQLTAEGLTSKEVADRLSISPRTVEKHRDNLMGKLGLHTQAELIRYAVKKGLVAAALSARGNA